MGRASSVLCSKTKTCQQNASVIIGGEIPQINLVSALILLYSSPLFKNFVGILVAAKASMNRFPFTIVLRSGVFDNISLARALNIPQYGSLMEHLIGYYSDRFYVH